MKERSTTFLLRTLGAFVAIFLIGQASFAQIATGSLPSSYSQNFDTYVGSAISLPTGWTAASVPGGAPYNGVSTGAGGAAPAAGLWALGTGGNNSIGVRIAGAGPTYTSQSYSVNFENTSSLTITELTFSWNYEQWRYQAVNPQTSFTVAGTGELIGNATLASKGFVSSGAGTNGTVSNTPVTTFTLTGLAIAPGQTYGITWTATGFTGGPNANMISVDDFSAFACSSSNLWYLDADADTYHVRDSASCNSPGAGWVSSGTTLGDCYDFDPAVYLETYWFLDHDADGYYVDSVLSCLVPSASYTQTVTAFGDCNDSSASVYVDQTWFLDFDGDGKYIDDSLSCNSPGIPQWKLTATTSGDCNDANPDPLVSDRITKYWDKDGDGIGRADSFITTCPLTPGYSTSNTDCDDNDPTRNLSGTFYRDVDGDYHPRNLNDTTLCWNGVFLPGYVEVSVAEPVDCDDLNPDKWVIGEFYVDADGDGYTPTLTLDSVCYGKPSTVPANSVDELVTPNSGFDCNDNVDTINVPLLTFYKDRDLDGFGDTDLDSLFCFNPGAGYSDNDLDCDDTLATVYPRLWFYDNDGDGFGGLDTFGIACFINNIAGGLSLKNTDCSDFNPFTFKNVTVYTDVDGDNYTIGNGYTVCIGDTFTLPLGTDTINLGTDCNDNDATVYQGQLLFEDQDGDTYTTLSAPSLVCVGATVPQGYRTTSGGVDCDDDDAQVGLPPVYYVDADNDGFGVGTGIPYCQNPGAGFALNNIDCNDNDVNAYRNGAFFVDNDGDGYTVSSVIVCYGATIPTGYKETSLGFDCNDNNAAINPAATEIVNNGIDENCNGSDSLYIGIDDVTVSVSSVHPNPGTDFATITLSGSWSQSIDVIVRDIEGRQVSVQTIDLVEGSATVATKELASGLYVFIVKDARNTATARWMKN